VPIWVARALLHGKAQTLHEITMHPARPEDASTAWEVLGSTGGTSLEFVFADGIDPVVEPGTFDTIVTPWFVDEVVSDLPAFMARLARLLPEGGTWLDHGPLVWNHSRTPPGSRFTSAEVLELVRASGFEVLTHVEQDVEYLRAPKGTQGRIERVRTMSAARAWPR
jgi:hypothetical protein